MKDDLNNYVQDIDTDPESRVEWVMRDEDLDKKDPKKEKEENQELEIQVIQKSIEEQQEEIKRLQQLLEYYESGAAYRENEALFGSGNITEEEFFRQKNILDAELDKARLDLNDANTELQVLLAKKGQITGVMENSQLEEVLSRNQSGKLEGIDQKIEEQQEEMKKKQEELNYYESGAAYRENESLFGAGVINEDEFFAKKEILDKELDKARENVDNATNSLQELLDKKGEITGVKKENNVANFNGNNNTQNRVQGQQFGSINNGISQNSQVKTQEPEINPSTTQQLDLYRKQNAFMSLVRKVMAKIKSFGGREDTDKLERVASEEVNRQVANLDTVNMDENALGDSLSAHVYSEEEIINNINRRESLEREEKEVNRNIEDVTI